MDTSRNRGNDHLGVNKIGKNIKKSPIHQPNFANSSGNSLTNDNNSSNNDGNAPRQQPQPQVYNISKNDFRSIVQRLTGSPARDGEPLPRPPNNPPPKPKSMRLLKIRPPPLSPMNRPRFPPQAAVPTAQPLVPFDNSGFVRPAPFGQPSPKNFLTVSPGVPPFVGNINESPISAYMRYLQTSFGDPSSGGDQASPQPLQQQILPPSAGLLPNPHPPPPMFPSPRFNGPMPFPPFPNLPSPQLNGGPVPALLPSPTSQFLLPSPSSYLNMQSPKSPYPLLSPGFQFPPPLTPNFFSPMTQPGILGPGPQPPPSPGFFPVSLSGFFGMPSPRWRNQ